MQTALNWLRTMFSLVKEINKKSSTSCMDFVYFGSCMDFRCVTECMEIRFPYILSHICHTSEILFVLSVKPFCLKPPSIHREGMPGHMCSEHAAVRWSVPTGDCGDVRRPLLLPQGLQWCVTDPAGRFSNVPGLCLPLRSHAQVQLWTSTPSANILLVPWVCPMNIHTSSFWMQTGAGQGGRIERCTEGPGQPGHLPNYIWGDRAETCRPDNRSPLPSAWLCSPTALWERYVNGSNCS